MVYECWAESPDDRPHFHELVATFSGSLEGIAGYLDFSLAGNPPQISGYDQVQLELKNGYDHLDQLQTVIVSDPAVDVSVDNVTDCNAPVDDISAPVDDITICNMQIDDVTDCNIICVPIDDVTDCSIPVDDVTDHDTEVVIPDTNEQL